MNTDALIESLARQTSPVPRHTLERRLGAGILAGTAIALLLLLSGLGTRPDLEQAAGGTVFWGKASYTLALGLAGVILAAQLARPDAGRLRGSSLATAPVLVLMLFAAAEMSEAAAPAREQLVLGPRWICLPLILMLSAPIFAGVVWAFRRMAPTRLRAAGAAAGLASGGFAATLYGLYCQQVSPTYILTRYTVAVALASAAGALLGPRLLRW
jgi:hypothetical protein